MGNPEAMPEPGTRRQSLKRGHAPARMLGLGAGGLLAFYLVVRGVVEFFTIDYSDPASYRDDWGGPSLAGVLAVHSGPGAVVVTATVIYLCRRRRARRQPDDHLGSTRDIEPADI